MINKIKLVFLSWFFIPIMVLAEFDKLPNPGDDADLASIIKKMINGLLQLTLPLIFLAFIYVGYLFVVAQGEPDKLKEAKRAFIYVALGTAIILGAQGIYGVINKTWNNFTVINTNQEIKINLNQYV